MAGGGKDYHGGRAEYFYQVAKQAFCGNLVT
jgi:hypothetical protein